MKRMLLAAVVLLAACGQQEEAPPPESPAQGRAETQSIRNTEAVGYDGAAIADKVDAALDANDQRVQQAQEDPEQ